MNNKNWIAFFKTWKEAEDYFNDNVRTKDSSSFAFNDWVTENYPDNFHVESQTISDQKEMQDYNNVHQS